MSIVRLLRRFTPPIIRSGYHRWLGRVATFWYRRPSRHLLVIGVTGTDGKSTTTLMTAACLQAAGRRVGISSGVVYQVGNRCWANTSGMTMPGRFALHRLLRQMVDDHCDIAVIEVSSEGLRQGRDTGIDFDAAIVTNVTPEHIEAHGSFEAYRSAKGLLFARVAKGPDKIVHGQRVKKTTVVNLDDPASDYFLKFWAEEHHGTTLNEHVSVPNDVAEKTTTWCATDIHPADCGVSFTVDHQRFTLKLPGAVNVQNALQAIAMAKAYGVTLDVSAKALATFEPIPGRFQNVPTGKPWRVVVDDALTPAALELLYQALRQQGAQHIIGVFGAAGGGRDTWKRSKLGAIAAQYCSKIILTTDDPFDEDPATITAAILEGVPVEKRGMVETVLDRREAISAAMEQAQPGDVIAITGMGSQTTMRVRGGKKVRWSDAGVVKELSKS